MKDQPVTGANPPQRWANGGYYLEEGTELVRRKVTVPRAEGKSSLDNLPEGTLIVGKEGDYDVRQMNFRVTLKPKNCDSKIKKWGIFYNFMFTPKS
jgi:hypothetical protein